MTGGRWLRPTGSTMHWPALAQTSQPLQSSSLAGTGMASGLALRMRLTWGHLGVFWVCSEGLYGVVQLSRDVAVLLIEGTGT
jgi:hypothetical protein